MWYVYMVRCKNNAIYTGVTVDMPRRLREHNTGKGGRYTRAHRPVALIHKEAYQNKSEALKREAKIKTFTKKKKLSIKNL